MATYRSRGLLRRPGERLGERGAHPKRPRATSCPSSAPRHPIRPVAFPGGPPKATISPAPQTASPRPSCPRSGEGPGCTGRDWEVWRRMLSPHPQNKKSRETATFFDQRPLITTGPRGGRGSPLSRGGPRWVLRLPMAPVGFWSLPSWVLRLPVGFLGAPRWVLVGSPLPIGVPAALGDSQAATGGRPQLFECRLVATVGIRWPRGRGKRNRWCPRGLSGVARCGAWPPRGGRGAGVRVAPPTG